MVVFILEGNDDKKFFDRFLEHLNIDKKPIANMYRELYPYPKFDFKHQNFNPLKEKLQNLFKED